MVNLGNIEYIVLMVKLFLVIMIYGFAQRWTGDKNVALVVTAILSYLFVFKYFAFGAGWIVLSNIFMLIIFVWFLGMIIPK